MSKVLLLEPNNLIASQTKAFLEAHGHRVIWCKDAQSGITTADTNKPDIVVVELLLAGHSGMEFLYEFRSYAEWRMIPAIVLSSVEPHNMDLSKPMMEELGIVAHLYKSETSLEKLCKVIDGALGVAIKKP